MDLNGIMVSKINQTEKDKYCMISARGGIKKAQQTNKQAKTQKKRSDLQKQRVGGGLKEGGQKVQTSVRQVSTRNVMYSMTTRANTAV